MVAFGRVWLVPTRYARRYTQVSARRRHLSKRGRPSRRACRARLGELRDRQDLIFARWTLNSSSRSTDFMRVIRRARHALRRLSGTTPA